jgi:hypothetical protein
MRLRNKILIGIAVAFVIIQFIRPQRNKTNQSAPASFESLYSVPDTVNRTLHVSCYDCHSNNTNYPWYSNIQPVGWFLQRHITRGKAELNFDDFGTYTERKKISKLKSMMNEVSDGKMPLCSYTMIHSNAKLSVVEKRVLVTWLKKTTDSLLLQWLFYYPKN